MIERPVKGIAKAYFCHVIMVPIYYENEPEPAFRTVFKGTEAECKEMFSRFPDELQATEEENRENRKWKYREMQHAYEIGNHRKAERIRRQYGF